MHSSPQKRTNPVVYIVSVVNMSTVGSSNIVQVLVYHYDYVECFVLWKVQYIQQP